MGPATKHYRCYCCYVPESQHEQISDTVEFFPHEVKMPAQSSTDKALQAIQDLIHMIQNPTPPTPFPTFGPEHTTALEELANIFNTSKAIKGSSITRVKDKNTTPNNNITLENQNPNANTHAVAASLKEETNKDCINSVIDPATGATLEYNKLTTNQTTKQTWELSSVNEFGRLMQGVVVLYIF